MNLPCTKSYLSCPLLTSSSSTTSRLNRLMNFGLLGAQQQTH
ncbi:hypothetical protein NC651_005254 [Populus alba x Populus x berolinensis]|nr:hypothetical protein NC651_005254 [Populus alba x Populus x berolinensis]